MGERGARNEAATDDDITFDPDATRIEIALAAPERIVTGTADLDGTGSAEANTLVGNDGINRLTGGGGNDSLDGGAGADLPDTP